MNSQWFNMTPKIHDGRYYLDLHVIKEAYLTPNWPLLVMFGKNNVLFVTIITKLQPNPAPPRLSPASYFIFVIDFMHIQSDLEFGHIHERRWTDTLYRLYRHLRFHTICLVIIIDQMTLQ